MRFRLSHPHFESRLDGIVIARVRRTTTTTYNNMCCDLQAPAVIIYFQKDYLKQMRFDETVHPTRRVNLCQYNSKGRIRIILYGRKKKVKKAQQVKTNEKRKVRNV